MSTNNYAAYSPLSATHSFSAGFPYVDNSYQSPPPPVVCQLCFSPCHSALHCSRFTGSTTPALAALPTGETHDSVWYPDSGASAHMTPHEGIYRAHHHMGCGCVRTTIFLLLWLILMQIGLVAPIAHVRLQDM
ncbi:unnamed protein product [Cuscuta europaea]|uniref:Uncharacterized protein n=1 Tax=Cuscuta europaea TaxID=41803 RepID=A0A9P0YLP4_CUSEU|nr:unnamed protein product [Cuscuta europaea]